MTCTNINTKFCPHCETKKALKEFSKKKNAKDDLSFVCRGCAKLIITAYRKTKEGVASRIYNHQHDSSKKRGHDAPSYTKAEFSSWLFSQSNFDKLFNAWTDSGQLKAKKPSCDRLDDYKPYTLDNIQLTTWKENNAKGQADRVNGINNKHSKAVIQTTKSGVFIKEHYSQMQASRDTGTCNAHISRCCSGELKSANGFKWEYVCKPEDIKQ